LKSTHDLYANMIDVCGCVERCRSCLWFD